MEEAKTEPELPITSGGSAGSLQSKTGRSITSAGSVGSAQSKSAPEAGISSKSLEQPVTEESSKESTSTTDPAKPHRTTITLTLAIAYPKPTDEHSRILEELVKKNKRTIESPKPIQFLHCNYIIAPENEVTATDVVTYAVAAKVFTEADSRVVKTWDDGRKIWVAWIHSHEIEVSLDNVVALHNHVVDIKLWDAKEKLSSKARSDKPKAFRLPSDTEFKFPGQGVHGVVSRVSNSWLNAQPRNSVTDAIFGKDSSMSPLFDPASENEVSAPNTPDKDKQLEKGRSSVLGKLAGINPSDEEKKRLNELKQQKKSMQRKISRNTSQSISSAGKKSKTPTKDTEGKKKGRKESGKKQANAERAKCVTMKIKLEHLFAGLKTVAARLEDRSGSIVDGFVTITTDKTFLPPRMAEVLNPMCIKIRSAKDLPNFPIPQAQLAKTSQPVFCQYDFLDQTLHTTRSRPHGKHVYFEDTHVIFLGLLNAADLREYIMSNSFQIEVHDRDMIEDEDKVEGTIFGVEKSDEDLSNVALVSAKRTAYNAFKAMKKAFDPYGVAKVPLIDLLRGRTSITAEVVVSPCAIPEVITDSSSKDDKDSRLVGVPGAVDRPERPPQAAGAYLEAGTTLKLKITLNSPLVPLSQAPRLLPLPQQINPFSRMVIYFDYNNKDLLKRLEHFVTMANAKALGLDSLGDKNVIDAALSTYKLTKQQKQSLTLDIITGFHLIDGNVHLMVLEGLRCEAMQRLLDELDLSKKEDDELLVQLYDTSQTFKHRMYSALDVDLCRIRLHESIQEIMSQPLVYIRDIIPRECLECVSSISQMLKIDKLRDVVYTNLFPTSEMVISMSREFGIPLTYEDFENKTKTSVPTSTEQEGHTTSQLLSELAVEPTTSKKSRMAELDNSNMKYERLLRERKSQPIGIDHVSANIIAVQETGKRRRPSHPSVRSLQVDLPAHNYSTQHLNTTEIAKDLLREMLQENDPQGRYSYNTDYLSAMVPPVDLDAHYRKLDQEAKKSWRTPEGFVYPGTRTSAQDNQHPLKPVDSRISDLKRSFRDNVLHRNIMEPNLERDRYRWRDRSKDLNLFSKPVPNFGSDAPYSIMLGGDLKKEEENRFKAGEAEEWRRRLIVGDPMMRFHRLLWETEDSNRANQLDKLVGVLKDKPIKYSLAKRPAPQIPPLSVLFYPSVDRDAREAGVKPPSEVDEKRKKNKGFAPGPDGSRRWVMEGNRIPIKDEEHFVFAEKHGHDMRLHHKERKLLSQRIPVKPLTEEEYQTHLFRIPPIEPKEEQTVTGHEEVYGKGPREKSEYRVKYPAHESLTRIREVYPRHTFRGFEAMDKDGKLVTRDASIQLMTSETGEPETTDFVTEARPEKGTILKDEASVEITPAVAALPSVEVA